MALTLTQLQAVKADIAANPDLSSQPDTGDGAYAIAQLYMNLANPDFYVWNTAAPATTVLDAITWANLTPTDAPDGTALWQGRSLACQGKQFNVQTILVGRELINGAKANIRAGLQDALSNVPSGVGGAAVSAGWNGVKAALTRKATRIEKLLASGPGTQATPATMTFEGYISTQDILDARVS